MKFAYADPPYIGQAKRLYGDHPDFAGEVDHAALIVDLLRYDGWALSCRCSMGGVAASGDLALSTDATTTRA